MLNPPRDGLTASYNLPRPRAIPLQLFVDGEKLIPLPDRQRLVVGSSHHVDVSLKDRYISSQHLALTREPGGVLLEDLGSKNGTFLDGVRVERARASVGDTIDVGQKRLTLVEHSANLTAAKGTMVGSSRAMVDLRRTLGRLAPLRQPVLIRGETGTGKELAAHYLHDQSPRAKGPFIAINCAAISPALAESELFGHLRGAFTGAHRDHAGAFERAADGTLFLDEIGELPIALQAKLLRTLEQGVLSPVGGEKEIKTNARVVAATHRDLPRMCLEGTFREDLFHRLGVLPVTLPALRERPEDIEPLLRHFAGVVARELNRAVLLSDDAITAARKHLWPGNVRALRNNVLRAAVHVCGPIEADHLLPAEEALLLPPDAERLELHWSDYPSMRRQLAQIAVQRHGSIRRAAEAIAVPRSTLQAWLKK